MKLPLWAKNEQGKIEPFPFHLLETLIDGSQGFNFDAGRDRYELTTYFGRFRNHFEWNPIDPTLSTGCQYRLKHQ